MYLKGQFFCALLAGLCPVFLPSSRAQFSANFQTNVISGVVSNWIGIYHVGSNTFADVLLIQNGGVLANNDAIVGDLASSSNNSVLVTGTGSVWSNAVDLCVGLFGAGNHLVISNQGAVFNRRGILGDLAGSSNNSVLVTGTGSVWNNSGDLTIGLSSDSNVVTIAGGTVSASIALICSQVAFTHNNVIQIDSGSLVLTNAAGDGGLIVSPGGGKGELILNGGTITLDGLYAINGTNSVVTFNGGTLHTKATLVKNNQPFVVGNGASAATFHLLDGSHSFKNSIHIRNNATLIGCVTITNPAVVVDAGGTVLADCGGTLTLTGSVTNNGTIIALNGTTLEALGVVVNNGFINAIHGATNFPGGIINYGILLDANGDYDGDGLGNLQEDLVGTDPTNSASVFGVTGVTVEGDDVRVAWTTAPGKTNALQVSVDLAGSYTDIFAVTNTAGPTTNYLDIGAVTNYPARYYRIRLVP